MAFLGSVIMRSANGISFQELLAKPKPTGVDSISATCQKIREQIKDARAPNDVGKVNDLAELYETSGCLKCLPGAAVGLPDTDLVCTHVRLGESVPTHTGISKHGGVISEEDTNTLPNPSESKNKGNTGLLGDSQTLNHNSQATTNNDKTFNQNPGINLDKTLDDENP